MSEAFPGHSGVQLEHFALVWPDNRPDASTMLSGQCYQRRSGTSANWASCGVALNHRAICSAVVSNAVVSNPVVSNPVVSNPVVSDAVGRDAVGRDAVICNPTGGRS